MTRFLNELNKKNPLLFWFGWFNLFVGITCLFLIFVDKTHILGLNRWVKPSKFYLSVWLMVWTLGWLMQYLQSQRKVLICSILVFGTMLVENGIIIYQAIRKQPSHFNVSTSYNAMLFSVMGILIMLFTLVCVYILVLFFKERNLHLSKSYTWGIRMGLLLFIFFSLEGGVMVGMLSHTIAGRDGGPGLPFLNWSTRYGDLRIAHFMGIHALQLIPLAGYYVFKTKKQVLRFSLTYFLAVMAILLLALLGMPLIAVK